MVENMSQQFDNPISSASALRFKKPERIKGLFIRGPIPFVDIVAAGRLSGKTLHVYLVILLAKSLQRDTRKPLIVTPARCREIGISRQAVAAAVKRLAEIGIIRFAPRGGGTFRVYLLAEDCSHRKPEVAK